MNEQRKILIAGPPYRNYLKSLWNAFTRLGMTAKVLGWDYPRRNLAQDAWFYASKAYQERLREAQHIMDAGALEREIERYEPDVLLVMKSAILTKRAQRLLRNRGATSVLWAYDNVGRFPIIKNVAGDYDLIYTYEPDDVPTLAEEGRAALLHMAYDHEIYWPSELATIGGCDIAFVGAVRDLPNRKNLIKTLAHRFPERSVGVWTDTIHWYSHRRLNDIRFKGLQKNITITPRTITHCEAADIYRGAKVCLNIHHQQSKACNPRTFEVMGAGGLLVTDIPLDHVAGFESGKGYVHYSTVAELFDAVEALGDTVHRARIAAEGLRIVRDGHTYVDRAKTIMSAVDGLGG